jgi:hypothetical protein
MLTDAQIDCWRQVLGNILGPKALTMPKEEIQTIHDAMEGDEESQRQMLNTVLPIS